MGKITKERKYLNLLLLFSVRIFEGKRKLFKRKEIFPLTENLDGGKYP